MDCFALTCYFHDLLYYTKIGIGTPPKEYHVQVDTGSDIMWINCIQCQGCVNKGYHGLDLTQYDPNASYTEKPVTCQEEICKDINGVTDTVHGCKANASCFYNENYGDGSNSMGYMVKDVVQYDSVFGDLITQLEKASVIFGCGTIQTGTINSSDDALDGILGFGNSNASVISQLASSGKVKRMFAHCLDSDNGGGIFAIGHVVQPKVNSTHLIQEQGHYTVNVTGIEVDAEFLNLSTYAQHGGVEKRRAIIDSGTTLAYLPEVIYKPLVNKIITGRLDMRHLYPHDGYTCMDLSGSLDGEFPAVTFHFESSLSLKVYPHDYLFAYDGLTCLGWQKNDMGSKDIRETIVLGDFILSNKLVLYDLEKQTIGWTEYNCSSNITIMDDISKFLYLVGSHRISSAFSLVIHRSITFMLLVSLLIIHAK
ncbi:putative nepenthesin [Helianthus annuus]|uniref:Nepenthesin n=1 Tax=Helianthus annuus TaxID=4232 RepID=A0A9K3HRW3_HELAN|nr:putative nepenthesin [Helianthus annuus]KAJ0518667.1 putative nepenthesin [Helianthus annuus]KAJ0686709.1 putative nepenthesin [Helianthus annuus]KAJ0690513.1 putative nepenthesin [Helianthus annuus]